MQSFRLLMLEAFERLHADLEMLADTLAIKLAGHPCELDFAVQRFVRDAEQGAVGNAETIAVGGNRRGLHVERNRARLRQPPYHRRAADFPIAVIDARDRSGAHQPLELEA